MNARVRELHRLLDRTADPEERDRIEATIATIAEDLDDPQPTEQQLDEFALLGENRYEAGIGWGRDDV